MSNLIPGHGVALTDHRVRLFVASEPATFLFLLGGLLATFIFTDIAALLSAVAAVTGVVTAAPWIPPLRRRAEARHREVQERQNCRRRTALEQQTLRELPLPLQNRFWVVRNRVWSVSNSLAEHRDTCSNTWHQIQEQLGRLPANALHLLRDLNNVERLLENADELRVYRELDELERELVDASPRLRAIKASRQTILRRRQSLFQQAHEEREVLLTQLTMIEDIIDLLRDASLIADDTTTITQQLDDMMLALDVVEEANRDTHALTDEAVALAVFEQRLAG